MTTIEMELSWLVFIATRENGMSDAQHAGFKRQAWSQAKSLAAENPAEFSELPAMLTAAMTAAAPAQ